MSITTPKPWWKSKTIWGVIFTLWFAVQPQIANFAEEGRSPTSGEWFNLASLLISTGFSIYGRLDAKQPLSTKPPS